MKNKKCKHEWEEDELFASGVIGMVSGKIGELKEETRMICSECGKVKYQEK